MGSSPAGSTFYLYPARSHRQDIFIMTQHKAPSAYYNEQLDIIAGQAAAIKKQEDAIAWLRLLAIIALAVVTYLAFSQNNMFFIASALLLAAVVYIINRQSHLKNKAARLQLYNKLLNDELNALKGDISAFYPGENYINSNHPYSYDLDIFGHRSVYQLLNRTVTKAGADTLANLLQHPYSGTDEILARQELNKELADKPQFLHRFRITGMLMAEEENAGERIEQWLEQEDLFQGKKIFEVLQYIVPVLSLLFLTLSVMQGILHPGLVVMLAINWGINIRYKKKIKMAHYLVSESVKTIDKTEQLLHEVAKENFTGSILTKLKTGMVETVASITKLKKLVHLFDNRQNGMVGPLLNSLFMFDVHCMLRLEKWRSQYKNSMRTAIQQVGTIDAYNSTGNYTFNHPHNIYPHLNTIGNTIKGEDLKHPLIDRDTAVGNNFSIGDQEQLYILTGANMTGKSTFIRTIGINLLFAYIGVPVPAASFSIPLIKLYTSIRVTDSVQDDVSYFKAELLRMQLLMKEVSNSDIPYMILLDEPLRGTNSTDKQAGTKAIIERLLQYNAIGIIATHDTALCTMADDHPGKISNYHFESEVIDNTLHFDYTLKAGGSTSNNATALMRMMGIVS